MTSKSVLKVRHNLVWETDQPLEGHSHQSPVFSFMNSKWILEISCKREHMMSMNKTFTLILINYDGMKSFLPFDVTTYLEDRRNHDQMLCSRINVSSSHEILFKQDLSSMYSKLRQSRQYDDMTIICSFSSLSGSVPSTEEKEDKSVQASLSSSMQVYPVSNVLDSTLKSLSKDISSLLNKSFMADVRIKCGERTVSAHKAILSTRSGVFSDIFCHRKAESDIIEITDVESHIFDLFLKYLYSGEFPENFDDDTIVKLYTVSDKYAVHTLKNECSNYMIKTLNVENFSKVLVLADKHDDKELKKLVVDFVAKSQENNFRNPLLHFYNKCNIL